MTNGKKTAILETYLMQLIGYMNGLALRQINIYLDVELSGYSAWTDLKRFQRLVQYVKCYQT